MKLLLIGSSFRMDRIEKFIHSRFKDIALDRYIYMPSDLPGLRRVLEEMEPDHDAVLFSGVVPYQVALSLYTPIRPWEYMKRDERQLMKALLTALAKTPGADIRCISVDSYSKADLIQVYNGFGIQESNLNLAVWDGDIFSADYIEQCTRFHASALRKGCSFAITGSYPVCQQLKAEQLPVIPLQFDEEAILQAVESLLLAHFTNDTIVPLQMNCQLAIRDCAPITELDEQQRFVLRSHLKLLDNLYFFAQKYDAAIYDFGRGHFSISLLLSTDDTATHQSLINELLVTTQECGTYLSIGIGFGTTERYAKDCAEIAYRQARASQIHCAYVAYRLNHVDGPLLPANPSVKGSDAVYSDTMLADLSQKTGLTLAFLDSLKMLYLTNEILTTRIITEQTDLPLRKVNHALNKLEEHHAVSIIGNKLDGKRGRPLRIIRVLY